MASFTQDNAWKDALNHYFPEFVAFFFPAINAEIDWRRGYEFLDQELQQVTRDHRVGRRLADKLVKVYLLDGTEQWLLIHLEVQGTARAGLAKRIYIYNYRIFDRYDCEVVSLVLLTGGGKSRQPQSYEVKRWGCELTFRFPVVRLVDYEDRWPELEASRNPFAIAVMAHLRLRQARGDQRKKRQWKRELIFGLYERGYSRAEVLAFFRFIDWVMVLPLEMERKLRAELYQYEEEKRMPYISSWERLSMQEGARNVVLRQLKLRMGEIDPKTQQRIEHLSLAQLDALGEALLDFTGARDLQRWLKTHAKRQSQGNLN